MYIYSIYINTHTHTRVCALLVAQMVKNLPAVKSWVQSLDGEGNFPGFLPGEPHGQRSLAGYRVHGGIEMDTTDSFLFSAEIQ